MMQCKKTFWAVMLGLLAVQASAQEAFDLAKLETLALATSRPALASRSSVDAAKAGIESARAFPNPEIEVLTGTQRLRGAGAATGDVRSVGLSQPIDVPWIRAARIGAAEAGLNVAQAASRGFEAELLARLRLRYFEVLRREAELKNAREDMASMESVRSRIAKRVETGEAPRFELIKADTELLNAQKSSQVASFRIEQARSLLRQVVGEGLSPDFALAGRLRDVPSLPPLEKMRQEVESSSPDLARVRAEMVRAERQLDLEKRLRWPSLAVKATLDDDPEVRASKVGIVMVLPLWDRRSGPVGEATALRQKARYELEAQSFSLQQQLEAAYQQYEIAETQVNALESGIVRQAEEALKIAAAAHRFGERGFIEVLDAQRVYRAARGELIAARFELAAAWVEVEKLRAFPEGKTE